MTRRRLSPKRRAELLARYDGRCAECRDPLGAVWHADHIHQLAMGGGNELENFRALCVPCHARKSRHDSTARKKVRHITGANKPKPKRIWPSGKIQGRGFPKDIRRKMDGTVERREA
jgi:5-methylcytosine-specific restriction endonuclease McrA